MVGYIGRVARMRWIQWYAPYGERKKSECVCGGSACKWVCECMYRVYIVNGTSSNRRWGGPCAHTLTHNELAHTTHQKKGETTHYPRVIELRKLNSQCSCRTNLCNKRCGVFENSFRKWIARKSDSKQYTDFILDLVWEKCEISKTHKWIGNRLNVMLLMWMISNPNKK